MKGYFTRIPKDPVAARADTSQASVEHQRPAKDKEEASVGGDAGPVSGQAASQAGPEVVALRQTEAEPAEQLEEDEDEEDESRQRKRKQRRKQLKPKAMQQAWNKVKNFELPFPLSHPATNVWLLERAERVHERFTFKDGIVMDHVSNEEMSNSSLDRTHNFKQYLKRASFKDAYVKILMKEAAAVQKQEKGAASLLMNKAASLLTLGKALLLMLIVAGLAFRVWDRLSETLRNYIPGAGGLPETGDAMKRRFLTSLAQDEVDRTARFLDKKGIYVMFDESTDDLSNSRLSVIAAYRGKHLSLDTAYMDANNAVEYTKAFSNIFSPLPPLRPKFGNLSWSNVLAMSMDNSSVNVKFCKGVLLHSPHVFLIFDYCHLADHVGKGVFLLPYLKHLHALWTKILLKIAKCRRSAYINNLRLLPLRIVVDDEGNENAIRPKMPPKVKTIRWLPLFEELDHRIEFYPEEKRYIDKQYMIYNERKRRDKGSKKRKEVDDDEVEEIAEQEDEEKVQKMWTKASDYYDTDMQDDNMTTLLGLQMLLGELHSFLTICQTQRKPMFHRLFAIGEALKAHFDAIKTAFLNSSTTMHWDYVRNKYPKVHAAFENMRQKSKGDYIKCRKVIEQAASYCVLHWDSYWIHGAQTVPTVMYARQLEGIRLARLFNPYERNALGSAVDIQRVFNWPFFETSTEFRSQFETYRASPPPEVDINDFDIESFWLSKAEEWPILSQVALAVIWIPIGSAEVERAVSSLNRVCTDSRISLKPETVGMLAPLYYNNFV